MQTYELQKKLDRLAASVPEVLERLGIKGTSENAIEEWREDIGGVFGNRMGVKYRRDDGKLLWEPTSEWEFSHNIVTNEGLDYVLDATLSNGTAIGTWYVAAVKTDTTAAASQTYATPVYTEIAGSDVSETVREGFGDNAVSSQSIANGTVAQYTAATTVTLFGASLVGGGTAASTIANTAGGGTLFAYSKFASSKAMTSSDTIDITYTINASDV